MTITEFLPSDGELSLGEANATLRAYRELMEEALGKLPVDLSAEEAARYRAQFPDDPSIQNAMIAIYQMQRRKEVYWAFQFARRSFIVIVAGNDRNASPHVLRRASRA